MSLLDFVTKLIIAAWKVCFEEYLPYLCFFLSFKNFIVDDYSSDDDFIQTKTSFKGNQVQAKQYFTYLDVYK